MPPRATRADHYLEIAQFYGRKLVEDIRDPGLPEFVLVDAARRAAHFAAAGMRLVARKDRGLAPGPSVAPHAEADFGRSTSSASPS